MAIKIGDFQKTPWETWISAANFANDLAKDGGTIVLATSTITATDKDGTNVTSTVLNQTGKAVSEGLLQIRVRAGAEAASPYDILFRAITTLGGQYETIVKMKVKA